MNFFRTKVLFNFLKKKDSYFDRDKNFLENISRSNSNFSVTMQRPTKEDESKSPEKFAQHEYEIRERYFRNSNDPSRSNSSFLPPNPSNIPWQYHNFATAGIELRPPFEATTNYYYHHPQLHALTASAASAASTSQPQHTVRKYQIMSKNSIFQKNSKF